MYRYLTAKIGSASDAEDILQEVFCRLVRYAARLRFARRPRAFVFRIARNEANRFLRSKIRYGNAVRQEALLADSLFGAYAAPDESTGRPVALALAGLPDEQREVIILHLALEDPRQQRALAQLEMEFAHDRYAGRPCRLRRWPVRRGSQPLVRISDEAAAEATWHVMRPRSWLFRRFRAAKLSR